MLLVWFKRLWRCAETNCPQQSWSETHELIAPRAVLTSRAIGWATDALAHDDTTVSALARHLRVGWHTLWRAIRAEATARTSRPGRRAGVRTLSVDEHIVRHEALLFRMEVRDHHRFATHNCVRHDTTTLFAALEIGTGKITDACYTRHRSDEFLLLLKQVAKAYRG